jgi:RuvB-like protein 1 (pontin 52)
MSLSFIPYSKCSFSIQLLKPASVLSQINGRDEIVKADVEDLDELFFDAKTSAQVVRDNAQDYLS